MLKILKAIIRIIILLTTSLLITILVISTPIIKIAFDEQSLLKVLNDSNIYENVNKIIKENTIITLKEVLNEESQNINSDININVEDLINSIDINNLLRNLTNEIIDISYSF